MILYLASDIKGDVMHKVIKTSSYLPSIFDSKQHLWH